MLCVTNAVLSDFNTGYLQMSRWINDSCNPRRSRRQTSAKWRLRSCKQAVLKAVLRASHVHALAGLQTSCRVNSELPVVRRRTRGVIMRPTWRAWQEQAMLMLPVVVTTYGRYSHSCGQDFLITRCLVATAENSQPRFRLCRWLMMLRDVALVTPHRRRPLSF